MASAFGDALRKARKAQGETVTRVAVHTGFSTSYVSDVERGHRSPFAFEVIEKIALFLDADKSSLMIAASVSNGKLVFEVDESMPAEVVGLLYSLREEVQTKNPTTRRALVSVIRKLIA